MRVARLLVAVACVALAAPLVPGGPDPAGRAQAATAPGPLGHDRIAVRSGSTWQLRNALDGGPARSYAEGSAADLPVAGDWDGDGSAAPSLFRDGTWTLRDREQGPARTVRLGTRGDQPVVGDWDGDGDDEPGVFRRGTWFLRAGSAATARTRSFVFGRSGDVAVVGDWDGDGQDDIAVRRGAAWFQRDATSGGPVSRRFDFGKAGDVPLAGDWDHDGRDTPGVFRDGTWYFGRDTTGGPAQTTRFGTRGDRPLVRRTQGLAPGVTHAVVRDRGAPWVAHVAYVRLDAASSPETVLAGDRLRGTETVSSMVRRSRAVLGVNGDFYLRSGRPVHLYANDGRLVQTPTQLGRAFSLDRTGTRFSMGYPVVRVALTARGSRTAVDRHNGGAPSGDAAAAYDAAGASLEAPPHRQCYVGLTRTDDDRVAADDGRVETTVTTGKPRCGGDRPPVPATGTLLAAVPSGDAAGALRGLPSGTRATLSAQLGFPGAVDAMGGNPLLVLSGGIPSGEVDGKGSFFERAPRTAVGATADGRLVVVVVDGRQSGYSRGMTLRELAELMKRLGARNAVNLDGGGSAQMVVNGLVASRPSDGRERPVANALVVLAGADAGEADLRPPAPAPAASPPAAPGGPGAGPEGLPLPGGIDLPPLPGGIELPPVGVADLDPASIGGLGDALLRAGRPVSDEVRRSAEAFRAGR